MQLNLTAEIETEAMELMSGGPLGDGIGPGNTAARLNEKYGFLIDPRQLWELWKKYLLEDEHGK